jgi:hypothetical protein
MVKHDDAVNDPHQHAHDVLDPDNRDAHAAADGAEQVSGALHLGAIKPTQAFVGEQQPRLGGERARELKLLERGGAEPTGLRCGVGRQPDQVERFLRPTLRFRARNAAGLAVVGGERDVFEQRQLAGIGAGSGTCARSPGGRWRATASHRFPCLPGGSIQRSGVDCPRSG